MTLPGYDTLWSPMARLATVRVWRDCVRARYGRNGRPSKRPGGCASGQRCGQRHSRCAQPVRQVVETARAAACGGHVNWADTIPTVWRKESRPKPSAVEGDADGTRRRRLSCPGDCDPVSKRTRYAAVDYREWGQDAGNRPRSARPWAHAEPPHRDQDDASGGWDDAGSPWVPRPRSDRHDQDPISAPPEWYPPQPAWPRGDQPWPEQPPPVSRGRQRAAPWTPPEHPEPPSYGRPRHAPGQPPPTTNGQRAGTWGP
jgi:hypothetical protein